MFAIARLYNVSVDDIKAWNNLTGNDLSTNQDIIIKRKPAVETTDVKPPVQPQPQASSSAKNTYRCRKGNAVLHFTAIWYERPAIKGLEWHPGQ
ncbi:MAG: LysM peptidoglycan-binding domain-containing protein [Bacteroidota bacterium]